MSIALIIGATGLVGGQLVETLQKEKEFSRIVILSRRAVKYNDPKIEVSVINFDNPDPTQIKGDMVFCAIGTTIKKAGSKEKQYKIDCEYPAHLAAIAKQNGTKKFVLVSSLGANNKSGNFYLRTKGDLEEKLKAINFESLIIIRPSFILGKRNEFRFGEKIGIVIARLLKPLMVGGLKRYRGVNASDIAKKMVELSLNSRGNVLVNSENI